MNRVRILAGWVAVMLGLVHVATTPINYKSFSLSALWFIGAGLAIVFAGFLNLLAQPSGTAARIQRSLAPIANLAMFGLFVATWFLLLRQPQVLIGAAIFALLLVVSVFGSMGSR